MKHRIAPAIALAIGIGATWLMAAERATFILTNGERVSGEVVFHTEARTNIRADKNEFNVKVNTGTETPIPFAQVVAIDFVGGKPRAEEISALPATGHLVTFRNGETRQGQLIDFVSGTTVKWRHPNGQEQDFPMTDVRRVFLQVDRVRDIYRIPQGAIPGPVVDSGGTTTTAPATATSRRTGAQVTTVTVQGASPWTETNVAVRRGQNLQFEVSGQIYVNRTLTSGPAGVGSARGELPEPSLPPGALIGRISGGKPFAIAGNTGLIQMRDQGRLQLGINDDQFGDNSGSFVVNVVR